MKCRDDGVVIGSLPDVTRMLGNTKQAVTDLVRSGIVVKLGPGEYDVVESARRYIATIRQKTDVPDLTAARVRLTESKARIAEMDRQLRDGTMVSVETVWADWSSRILRCRARLLAMPAKLAARIRMAQTTVEVSGIIRAEVIAALEELGRADDDAAA